VELLKTDVERSATLTSRLSAAGNCCVNIGAVNVSPSMLLRNAIGDVFLAVAIEKMVFFCFCMSIANETAMRRIKKSAIKGLFSFNWASSLQKVSVFWFLTVFVSECTSKPLFRMRQFVRCRHYF